MSGLVRSGLLAGIVGAVALAAPATGPASAAGTAPTVEQLVVLRSGKALQRRVRAAGASVRVGRRRCAVAGGTPLAALVRSRPGRIGLLDYGRCSRRGRDGGQLFVRSIRGDRNRGRSGWVYKVDRREGTAGAADPAGPFGHGRLRGGSRVIWFYCHLRGASCQRTLELKATAGPGGVVTVRVRSYDDEGRDQAAGGAAVSSGAGSGVTDAEGMLRLTLPPGRHVLHAEKRGLIRSFAERVSVR